MQKIDPNLSVRKVLVSVKPSTKRKIEEVDNRSNLEMDLSIRKEDHTEELHRLTIVDWLTGTSRHEAISRSPGCPKEAREDSRTSW